MFKGRLSLILLIVHVSCSVLGLEDKHSPLVIAPEVYLDNRLEGNFSPPTALQWPLVITIVAYEVHTKKQIDQPMVIRTTEEFVEFKVQLTSEQPLLSTQTNRYPESIRSVDPFIEAFSFTAQVMPSGANNINLRCTVDMNIQIEEQVKSISANQSLRCIPNQEQVLLSLQGIECSIMVKWE